MWSDVWDYIRRLWRSWWLRVALINGLLGVTARVVPGFNELPVAHHVPMIFVWVMIALLVYSQFMVFTDIKHQLSLSIAGRDERDALAKAQLEGVINEIIFNLDHCRHQPAAMLRDEAFRVFESNPTPFLSPRTRNCLGHFYGSVRGLKATGGQIHQLDEVLESIWFTGHDALEDLKRIVYRDEQKS